MSADLTLPGSIPGLVRFATPLVDLADSLHRGVAVGTYAEGRYADHVFACWISGDSERVPLVRVALDLTDATGRAHAAWWALERGGYGMSVQAREACEAAAWGEDMTPRQVEDLRLVVLHLAGVSA